MIIYTKGPEGNAFAIMGVVQKFLRDTEREDEIEGVIERMMSGDYANLCAVAEEVSFGTITFVGLDEDE